VRTSAGGGLAGRCKVARQEVRQCGGAALHGDTSASPARSKPCGPSCTFSPDSAVPFPLLDDIARFGSNEGDRWVPQAYTAGWTRPWITTCWRREQHPPPGQALLWQRPMHRNSKRGASQLQCLHTKKTTAPLAGPPPALLRDLLRLSRRQSCSVHRARSTAAAVRPTFCQHSKICPCLTGLAAPLRATNMTIKTSLWQAR